MQQTAEIIFPKNGDSLIIPEEFELRQTKDGINYLIKEEVL